MQGWAGFNPFGQEESRKYSRGAVARLLGYRGCRLGYGLGLKVPSSR
jgi:hypothetical protein